MCGWDWEERVQRGVGGDVGLRRLRMAELTSSFGAGVLGVGIGVLAGEYLHRIGLPVLIAGLILHGWGMADKHRLAAGAGVPDVWWSTALYWICWVLLGGLVVYVFVG